MNKEQVVSPFCDKGATLKRNKGTITFRKEKFEITEHYYQCIETGEEFTNDEIDQINLNQVYNQYRDKFGLPFPDQIRKIREKYGVSASKMSEILGLGTNSYRLYEQGDVPSVGNGRLVLAADDPNEVKKFIRSSKEVLGEKEFDKLTKRVDKLIEEKERNRFSHFFIRRLFDVIVPDEFTGYRLPYLDKISHMILFFSERTETWKTKLNKLLFYADFISFKHSGYGISGLDYRAIQMGPVPAKFEDIYNLIANDESIVKREYLTLDNGNYGSVFQPIVNFNPSLFNAFELDILEHIANRLIELTPYEIIEKSHQESAWKMNYGKKDKRIISYKDYGFEIKDI